MNLLVAVDGSSESQEALDRAVEIAAMADGTITLVHAVNPDVYELGGMDPITSIADAEDRLLVQSLEDAEARGDDILTQAIDRVTAHDVDVVAELLYGPPEDRIIEYAEQHDVDGIYVGHRGMSDRLEGLLGSVAKSLTERAPVPVTVVH